MEQHKRNELINESEDFVSSADEMIFNAKAGIIEEKTILFEKLDKSADEICSVIFDYCNSSFVNTRARFARLLRHYANQLSYFVAQTHKHSEDSERVTMHLKDAVKYATGIHLLVDESLTLRTMRKTMRKRKNEFEACDDRSCDSCFFDAIVV